MEWHQQINRPITRADLGRLVAGFGVAGFTAGYVEELSSGLLVIDTGRSGGPFNGNVVVDIVQTYTFLEEP